MSRHNKTDATEVEVEPGKFKSRDDCNYFDIEAALDLALSRLAPPASRSGAHSRPEGSDRQQTAGATFSTASIYEKRRMATGVAEKQAPIEDAASVYSRRQREAAAYSISRE